MTDQVIEALRIVDIFSTLINNIKTIYEPQVKVFSTLCTK